MEANQPIEWFDCTFMENDFSSICSKIVKASIP